MSLRKVILGDIAVPDRVIVSPETSEAAVRPYLGLEQIASGTGHILSYETNSAEGKSTTFAFDDGHVLYGKLRPYLNKVAIPDRTGRCSTEIIPLKPRGVDREYLALLLRTEQVVSAAMFDKTGSRMPRADMDALLGFEVVIHDSDIQQLKIAAHLRAQLTEVETARQAAEMQLSDTRLLRSRLLKAFFAELDAAPKKKLGDYAETTSGSTPSRGNKQYWQPAEIAWVKTGEVAFAPITTTEEAISKTALAECSLTLAHFGFAKDGGILPDTQLPASLVAGWQDDETNTGKSFPSYARLLPQRGTSEADSRYSWTIDFAARRAKAREEMQPLLDEAAKLKNEAAGLKERLKRSKKDKAAAETLDALDAQIRDKDKAARDLESRAAAIDATVFDLKAVNPNAITKLDQRTPTQIIESIQAQGRIVAEALARLNALIAKEHEPSANPEE